MIGDENFCQSRDFFDRVDSVVEELKQQGRPELAQRLKSAKVSSAMPGELFGEIELALKEIQKIFPNLISVQRLLATLKEMY